MPVARFEVAIGTIDGVNQTFFAPTPYQALSTAVFVNGQLQRIDFDDGWIETNPGTGEFQLKIPPIPDDVVQIFYRDTTATLPGEEITPISGVLVEMQDDFQAVLQDGDVSLTGSIEGLETISGQVSEPSYLSGQVLEGDILTGIVEVCT